MLLHAREHGQGTQDAALDAGGDAPGLGHARAADDARERPAGARRLILCGDRGDGVLEVECAVVQEVDGTTGDPGGRCRDALQLEQEADGGRPATHDEHVLAAELLGGAVGGRVHLAAAEALGAGVVRDERGAPGAGRVDDGVRRDVAEVRSHHEVGAAVEHRAHLHGSAHLEVVERLVLRVVLDHDVTRGTRPVGRVEAESDRFHAGKVMDPMRGAEPERLPTVLPGAARQRPAVQDQIVGARPHAEPLQVVGDRESGLPGADDHDRSGLVQHIPSSGLLTLPHLSPSCLMGRVLK
ncbi:hypothetical protein GCM10025866_11490 [Naasia aerilata]|uniref:Uncharacterized protein n=1 Tax=Naasia aerilata TaxID=1162966 RepID=A0ABM8GAK6_9MICO|nr:hypothetical protein GCM10025866_11490 [Naasia aerilata]